MTNILLIVTQDTKQEEAAFLRDCLEDAGCNVIHLDPSVRKTIGGAEISPKDVAAATGTTLEDIRAIGHEGKIQGVMIEGAVKLALEVHAKHGLQGVLSIGGSMGTTLSTQVMQALPYGIPKVMISTLASGMTEGFVGVKDITMMNSVCDISGLNSISHEIFRSGAYGVAGMAKNLKPVGESEKPLVLMSTLGTTETTMRSVREALEADGCEVMVFHSTGNGGRTLEALAAERDVAAIVDMSLVEINDFLHDGICAVGPERGTTGLKRGIPTIFAPGNVDFYVMPTQLATGDAPFDGRRYHIHNIALTAVRTTEADLDILADHLAGMMKETDEPVSFFIPLGGFSDHDSTVGNLYEPSLPPLFAEKCKAVMPSNVAVTAVDAHINDQVFADAMVAAVRAAIQKN
ncbi:Tm-1-like ATP-binding domain-containing protein [Shimia sp.]|uniref:Tm-1-like ATP-binding domain-containing protein n=1 Tax=Shimia sp. TaxID=1954381 RepID=UPI003296F464